MLVRNKGGWTMNPNPVSIKHAIGVELRADGYGGQVEAASHNALEAISYLAKLTQLLHERGVLTDDDVMRLLPPYYEKVPEDTK